jgi:hypothetical protein
MNTPQHSLKRVNRDLFKLVKAADMMNVFLESIFDDFDAHKGDTVALLEETLVTEDQAIVSLRQVNEVALLLTSYR